MAVTGLILVGASLATIAAILSLTHRVPTQLLAFATVMLALTIDAVLVWRQVQWAVLLTLAGLAGQAVAVAGLIVELARGIADVKAHELQQLGFNPTVGVLINLIYSTIGFSVFGWFALRWLKVQRYTQKSSTQAEHPRRQGSAKTGPPRSGNDAPSLTSSSDHRE